MTDPTSDPAVWADRARLAHDALLSHFRLDRMLLREAVPRRRQDLNRYSYEWPHSQATQAATDMACAGIGPADVHDRGQESYWNPVIGAYMSLPRPPHAFGGHVYLDDNAWMGLVHVQRVLAGIGARKDLVRARAIHRFIRRGRDTDPDHPAPGGVFWTTSASNRDRNTVSALPPAQLALRLHELTGKATYLEDALPLYDWARSSMLAPEGLYWDHIDLAGTIDTTWWTYNQGVAIGVEALAWRATGWAVHRRRLDETIDASLTHFRPEEPGGPFDGQPLFFDAIYLKNLLLASTIVPDDRAARITRSYAERMWRTRCDPVTGVYRRPHIDHTELLEQAGMVQLCAVLAQDPRGWATLY